MLSLLPISNLFLFQKLESEDTYEANFLASLEKEKLAASDRALLLKILQLFR